MRLSSTRSALPLLIMVSSSSIRWQGKLWNSTRVNIICVTMLGTVKAARWFWCWAWEKVRKPWKYAREIKLLLAVVGQNQL